MKKLLKKTLKIDEISNYYCYEFSKKNKNFIIN